MNRRTSDEAERENSKKDMRPGEFPHCYGCGQANPIGLRLKVRQDD